MNGLRAWIILLALMCFTAGIACGMMLTARSAQPPRWGELAEYEALLVERFDLSGERARYLRALLQSYERDMERLGSKHRLTQDLAALQPEFEMKSREYDRLIRDKVLPPARRAEYAELCAPVPFPR